MRRRMDFTHAARNLQTKSERGVHWRRNADKTCLSHFFRIKTLHGEVETLNPMARLQQMRGRRSEIQRLVAKLVS
jgi:hypothetical protein